MKVMAFTRDYDMPHSKNAEMVNLVARLARQDRDIQQAKEIVADLKRKRMETYRALIEEYNEPTERLPFEETPK